MVCYSRPSREPSLGHPGISDPTCINPWSFRFVYNWLPSTEYVYPSLKGIVTQLSSVDDDAVCNSHDAFGGFYWPVMLRHIY